MDKKTRPTLGLKKKPAAPAPGDATPAPRPAPPVRAETARPDAKAAKPAKPAKPRKPPKVLPPHRRPREIRALALVETLQREHPALFPPDGEPITRPWAVGIHGQLMQRYAVSKRAVRMALEHWTKRRAPEYARCLAQDGPRFGLDGGGAGTPAPERGDAP